MLISRGRRTIATLVVLGTGVLASAALIWFMLPSEEPQYEELFSGTVPEESWPPAAPADLADELATTEAARRIGMSGLFADASNLDGGVRVGDVHGLSVRTGTAQGLFYIEAVFGDDADFDDPMPMALLIHGRGDRARIPGGPFWGLGAPLRVIVPQAPDPLGDGYEWLPVRVGQNLVDRLTTSLMARAAQLATFLREMRSTVPTVGKPMVVGFSQGGLLTFTLATHFTDEVQVAFPLCAWLPPALVPPYARSDYPPIRAMHGSADRVIPPGPTEQLFETLRERDIDAELVVFDGVGHEMTEAMDEKLHQWLLEAMGVLVRQGIDEGILDGGIPPCTSYADGGIPEAGMPEAGWPDGGAPCPDGGVPDAGIFEAGLDAR